MPWMWNVSLLIKIMWYANTHSMRDIVVIAHDLRSSHNVGSLLRTADGIGVTCVYLSGYTPYPEAESDVRLPHIRAKVAKDIHKTALGAEQSVKWQHVDDISNLLSRLKDDGYTIIALEQSAHSTPLSSYIPQNKTAVVIGREVEGIDQAILHQCNTIVEIPMFGTKESFNVIQATAMVLYHLRFLA